LAITNEKQNRRHSNEQDKALVEPLNWYFLAITSAFAGNSVNGTAAEAAACLQLCACTKIKGRMNLHNFRNQMGGVAVNKIEMTTRAFQYRLFMYAMLLISTWWALNKPVLQSIPDGNGEKACKMNCRFVVVCVFPECRCFWSNFTLNALRK